LWCGVWVGGGGCGAVGVEVGEARVRFALSGGGACGADSAVVFAGDGGLWGQGGRGWLGGVGGRWWDEACIGDVDRVDDGNDVHVSVLGGVRAEVRVVVGG